MAQNLTQKILGAHLAEGELTPGSEIAIRMDHTLLQDATGTMAMLEFEALGLERVRTELSAQYVDHNLVQSDFKNADDHAFLRSASARFGVIFSPPGNGISHQVHMERFGRPGGTLIGADSHTPGAAGVSMLGIGAGGLDVALAMAGQPYHIPCPKVLGVRLTGSLPDWVSAKDVILEMLRRYDVKGCVNKVVEYYGPGVASLSATDRETIGNMGAELGATSTIFPSDPRTKEYLEAQGRGDAWLELYADQGCSYDENAEIDLGSLVPLIACPSSPGNVKLVSEVAGLEAHQAIVGSSVNSSFRDLMVAARIMRGRHVHSRISLDINPGSQQVMLNVSEQGGAADLMQAGARIHQSGCLGCIGMGQAPGSGQVSLRTFPRNFLGRSGTKDDQVYLCSPETAAAAALTGRITDPRDLAAEMEYPRIQDPAKYRITANFHLPPEDGSDVEILRGPNITPLPEFEAMPETLQAAVAIKVGDNITTDGIMPAGAEVLPLRSNVAGISKFVFFRIDSGFPARSQKLGQSAVIAGENYGQGSSREHAALAPRYLGVRIKIAKSFARIHKANLCNFGILPLTFRDAADYESIRPGARLEIPGVRQLVQGGAENIEVLVDGEALQTRLEVSPRQREDLLAGGALNRARDILRNGT